MLENKTPIEKAKSGLADLAATDDFTEDAFLGGKVTIRQPRTGFRAGIDSVLLAAAVPAKSGERVFEAGMGPGVAGLCLAARAEGVCLTGLEIDPGMAALAARNAAANGLEDRISVLTGDVGAPPPGIADAGFDHAMANPPFGEAGSGNLPPDAAKARAHFLDERGLAPWLDCLLSALRPKGRLTLIHRTDAVGAMLSHFEDRLGDIAVFPLWAGARRPAKRVIVTGRKGVAAPLQMLPGLVLHEGTDFTPETRAVLREGKALDLFGNRHRP